ERALLDLMQTKQGALSSFFTTVSRQLNRDAVNGTLPTVLADSLQLQGVGQHLNTSRKIFLPQSSTTSPTTSSLLPVSSPLQQHH
ncbi:MAG: hypothetical protein EZS28_055564, partial [Streblomastix strix]